MRYLVYLAGQITGLTYEGATDWRDWAAEKLDSDKIETLSPMRGKSFLKDAGILHSGTYVPAVSTAKGIMRRDFYDCTRADCVLVNLLGAQKVSIGTMMELGFAYARQIPVVLVMEPGGNPHQHVMVEQAAAYIVPTLGEGVELVKFLFNDTHQVSRCERQSCGRVLKVTAKGLYCSDACYLADEAETAEEGVE